ncbi:prepilin-type N-terminal cleavage/methylation domain-containing protein, partial [Patescibacteria group bacterium]|nr:prepilin-type N-terminal cleavage/methylation domain-containing protein [Patescibacteria group bacterium]
MIKIFRKIQNEKGISLVELVVAVSIFSLVMIAATGIFISAIKAQKAIIAKQNVANNMRYAMEFMAKEIRMAQVDNTDPTLTFNDGAGNPFNNGDDSTISFFISSGNQIKYSLFGNKILRTNLTTADTADDDQSISSNEVSITGLNFKINNWNLTAGPAPLITIFMTAEAKNGVGGE